MIEFRWGKQPQEIEKVGQAILDRETYPEQKIWELSVKYILITLLCKIFHIKSSADDLSKLYADCKMLCVRLAKDDAEKRKKYLDGFEKMWPRLRELAEDPGFHKFVYKYAMDSAFMLPYFAVLSPHAIATEAAHGFSVDMGGDMREITPEDDPQAFQFVHGERTFRSFNFRAFNHQNFTLNLVHDKKTTSPSKLKIFFAGGGLTPWLRYGNIKPEMLMELFDEVVVYDKDPDMPEYLKMVFKKPLEEYGIKYHFDDFKVAYSNTSMWGKFDIVDCTGVASYCQNDEQLQALLHDLGRLLKPGGYMLLDRQVLTPDMLRCAFTLAWKTDPPLKPEFTVKACIKRMKKLVPKAGLVIDDYYVDEYSTMPALVDFILRKPG